MVKKTNPDCSKTITIGSVYEVNKDAGGTVTGTNSYYPAAGAMRVNGTLYYALGDQLGSASVVLSASVTTVGETRYTPFGETRVPTSGRKQMTYRLAGRGGRKAPDQTKLMRGKDRSGEGGI